MRSMRTAHLRRLLAAPGRARPFSSSQPYNPNVVNLARDPPPGKRFRWMRVFGTLACLMFAAPGLARAREAAVGVSAAIATEGGNARVKLWLHDIVFESESHLQPADGVGGRVEQRLRHERLQPASGRQRHADARAQRHPQVAQHVRVDALVRLAVRLRGQRAHVQEAEGQGHPVVLVLHGAVQGELQVRVAVAARVLRHAAPLLLLDVEGGAVVAGAYAAVAEAAERSARAAVAGEVEPVEQVAAAAEGAEGAQVAQRNVRVHDELLPEELRVQHAVVELEELPGPAGVPQHGLGGPPALVEGRVEVVHGGLPRELVPFVGVRQGEGQPLGAGGEGRVVGEVALRCEELEHSREVGQAEVARDEAGALCAVYANAGHAAHRDPLGTVAGVVELEGHGVAGAEDAGHLAPNLLKRGAIGAHVTYDICFGLLVRRDADRVGRVFLLELEHNVHVPRALPALHIGNHALEDAQSIQSLRGCVTPKVLKQYPVGFI
ncbi:DNA cytosine methyltransferase [Babesia caballi]|uniref:DNA cytosine methyltransferase n=1 Tax=Babesia caballi TaxID=5871 RepID=A0AAV4LPW3_BABCB|nr:DNA cytosine methyltransferase [Babesia caballi]